MSGLNYATQPFLRGIAESPPVNEVPSVEDVIAYLQSRSQTAEDSCEREFFEEWASVLSGCTLCPEGILPREDIPAETVSVERFPPELPEDPVEEGASPPPDYEDAVDNPYYGGSQTSMEQSEDSCDEKEGVRE